MTDRTTRGWPPSSDDEHEPDPHLSSHPTSQTPKAKTKKRTLSGFFNDMSKKLTWGRKNKHGGTLASIRTMQENETIDRVEKMFEPSSSPVTEEGVLHMQREREKKREAEKVVDRKGDGGEDVKTESTESLVYVKSREKGKENKNKTA